MAHEDPIKTWRVCIHQHDHNKAFPLHVRMPQARLFMSLMGISPLQTMARLQANNSVIWFHVSLQFQDREKDIQKGQTLSRCAWWCGEQIARDDVSGHSDVLYLDILTLCIRAQWSSISGHCDVTYPGTMTLRIRTQRRYVSQLLVKEYAQIDGSVRVFGEAQDRVKFAMKRG